MKTREIIKKTRKMADKVFSGELKEFDILFESESEERWYEYFLRGLKMDRYQ